MKRRLSRFQLSHHFDRGLLRLTVVNAVLNTAVAEDLIIDGFAIIGKREADTLASEFE
jgi:hypothetical protein